MKTPFTHRHAVPGTAYPDIKEYDYPKGSRLVHEAMSPYQLIRVFESPHGCWMSLSGDMQFHERECDISHRYMCDNVVDYFKRGRPTGEGGPPSILVIGGGDGMPGKRLQKYKIPYTQVELDPELIKTTKTVPTMRKACDDSFNSKYIDLKCGDGLSYLINSNRKWDIIIDDCDIGSTDQPNPEYITRLYDQYQKALFKKLHPYGILSLTEDILVLPVTKENTPLNRFLDHFSVLPVQGRPTWRGIMQDNVKEWKKFAPYGKHFGYDLPMIGPEHYLYMSKKPL